MTLKIRELRFGPPGTWKTNSIVSTYPKPMLVANWDSGGLDSVAAEKVYLTEDEFSARLADPSATWEGIYVRDYTQKATSIGESYLIRNSADKMQSQIRDFNRLISIGERCPIQTLVIDGGTRFIESLLSFEVTLNNKDRPNQDIYGLLGQKAVEIFVNLCESLPCHVAITAHAMSERDEITGEMNVLPSMLGSIREKIGGIMSQFLYAVVEMDGQGRSVGKVWTQPRGLVKGLKMRWPQDKPAVCEPRFEDLYGGAI